MVSILQLIKCVYFFDSPCILCTVIYVIFKSLQNTKNCTVKQVRQPQWLSRDLEIFTKTSSIV